MSNVITKKSVSASQFKSEVLDAMKMDVVQTISKGRKAISTADISRQHNLQKEVLGYMNGLSSREKSNLYMKSQRLVKTAKTPIDLVTRYGLKLESAQTLTQQYSQLVAPKPLAKASAAMRTAGGDEYKNYWDVDIKVSWSLDYIYCVDETDGAFGTEWGEDEIFIGGFSVDDQANVAQLTRYNATTRQNEPFDTFKVGNFDDTKPISSSKRKKLFLPSLKLAEFTIGSEKPMPIQYMTSFTLVEYDDSQSAIAKFFQKMVAKAAEKLKEEIGDLGLGDFGTTIGEFLSGLIDDFAKWLVDLFFGDDEFKPEVCSFEIPSASLLTNVGLFIRLAQQQYARGEISIASMNERINRLHELLDKKEVRTLKAHGGTYEVAYRWEVRYMMGLG